MKILLPGENGQVDALESAGLIAAEETSGYGSVSNKLEQTIAGGMWIPRSINLHNRD